MTSFLMNKSISLKTLGGVYIGVLKLMFGVKTYAIIRLKDILEKCDLRMQKYPAGVRGQDKVSSELYLDLV